MCFLYLFSGIIDDEFDDDDVTPPRSPLVVQNSNMGLSSKPLLLRPADNSPFTTGTYLHKKINFIFSSNMKSKV